MEHRLFMQSSCKTVFRKRPGMCHERSSDLTSTLGTRSEGTGADDLLLGAGLNRIYQFAVSSAPPKNPYQNIKQGIDKRLYM